MGPVYVVSAARPTHAVGLYCFSQVRCWCVQGVLGSSREMAIKALLLRREEKRGGGRRADLLLKALFTRPTTRRQRCKFLFDKELQEFDYWDIACRAVEMIAVGSS